MSRYLFCPLSGQMVPPAMCEVCKEVDLCRNYRDLLRREGKK